MELDELCLRMDKINIEDSASPEELKELISSLQDIINKQGQMIREFKNNYIRLENNFKLIEEKVEYYSTYKALCELILDKINKNPISALWFLRSIRKKIDEYYREH